VISLIGLCLLFMALFHWLLEPLEHVLTPLLELRSIGIVVLGVVIWVFASPQDESSEP
jgi:hypothetical protein